MSDRYVRGLITANPPADPDPALGSAASGMWTMEQYFALQKQGKWPTKDPYFNQTTLLLHGDGGLSGATNNSGDPTYLAFADNSDNDFPITVNGNARGDNSSPFQVPDGYWSNYFDGTGDYLSVADNTALDVEASDFTVEFFVYLPATPSGVDIVFGKRAAGTYQGVTVFFDGSLAPTFQWTVTGSTWEAITSSASCVLNQWNHVACTRSSNTWTIWVNGVSGATATVSGTVPNNSAIFTIGADEQGATNLFVGYISNFRLVKGTAVYTAGFTPPTSPLTNISNTSLLTCQSNRFVDNSSNGFAITVNGNTAVQPFNPFTTDYNTVDGSGYFDGTGDYITVPSDAAFALGTGDFCIEGWYFVYTNKNYNIYFDFRNGSGTAVVPYLYSDSTGSIDYYVNGGASRIFVSNVIKEGQWSHIAVIRSGTNTKLFVNGVQIGSTLTDTNNYVQGPLYIGRNNGGGTTYDASYYCSNFRIVKGNTGGYGTPGSTITVPTTPFTNISGTELLTVQYQGAVRNGGFIDSSPNDFPITANGNTTQGTFSPFSDGWSNYFDGTSDNLSVANNAAFQFGTGDFTVEAWVYQTVQRAEPQLIVKCAADNTWNTGWALSLSTSGSLVRFWINGSNVSSSGASTVTLNGWSHVAVSRSGTTLKMFIDGVEVDSDTNSTDILPTVALTIGADITSSAYEFQGYISNVRVVKGTALYTGAFTPPTAPLTAISGTSLLTCQSNRFVDNSSNAFAITRNGDTKVTPFSPFAPTAAYDPAVNGGSGYFDGTGDYLDLIDTNNDCDLGGRAASVDFWVYVTDTSATKVILNKGGGGTSPGPWNTTDGLEWTFVYVSGGTFYFQYNNPGGVASITSSISTGTWTHFAVATDASNNISFYKNGERVASPSSNAITKPTNRTIVRVGGDWTSQFYSGYIAGISFKTGANAYDPTDATITIPTAPPTNVTGTELLLNFTNAGIYDSTGKNVLETVANAQVDTSTVKFGTGSMKFDGTGDYLLQTTNLENYTFGTGPFTIEFWLYLNALTPDQMIFDMRPASTQGAYPALYFGDSGDTLNYYANAGNRITSSALSTGTWYHIAIARSGTDTKMFLDGTQTGSTYSDSTNYLCSRMVIGAQSYTLGNISLNGYIDDLRITKGVARYTSNFTPQTSQWQNQ